MSGLQIRHFEQNSKAKKLITQGKKLNNSRKKLNNSRKKLNNSAEKLKDLTKFTERRKKLKYFCCKNDFN